MKGATKVDDYLTDYEADADDRIIAALRARGCAFPDKLEPAARLAGAQLELLKPVVIGARAGRIYAGPAVMTKPGAISRRHGYAEQGCNDDSPS